MLAQGYKLMLVSHLRVWCRRIKDGKSARKDLAILQNLCISWLDNDGCHSRHYRWEKERVHSGQPQGVKRLFVHKVCISKTIRDKSRKSNILCGTYQITKGRRLAATT